MCMAIWSFGVCLVCHTYSPQNRQQQDTDLFADHAKLKDYVATMEGQLDAQIQEGGMSFFFSFFPLIFGASLSFRAKFHKSISNEQ